MLYPVLLISELKGVALSCDYGREYTKRCAMAELLCSGKKNKVDKEGFMTNYEDWDYSVAEIRAKREGI
jgi:hypothetical protein